MSHRVKLSARPRMIPAFEFFFYTVQRKEIVFVRSASITTYCLKYNNVAARRLVQVRKSRRIRCYEAVCVVKIASKYRSWYFHVCVKKKKVKNKRREEERTKKIKTRGNGGDFKLQIWSRYGRRIHVRIMRNLTRVQGDIFNRRRSRSYSNVSISPLYKFRSLEFLQI